MNWQLCISILALLIALCAFSLTVTIWKRQRFFMVTSNKSKHSHWLLPSKVGGKVYVIYNPSKNFDLNKIKEKTSVIASHAGMEEPVWLATTKEDSGYSMALKAIADKVDLVIAVGGDGTVRAVASGLAGSQIPLGILPLGTANLLARNLELPINDIDDMISIAIMGRNRWMDMGWMKIVEGSYMPDKIPDGAILKTLHAQQINTSAGSLQSRQNLISLKTADELNLIDEEEFAFLIMAGMGFDGDMMADVASNLKNKIGWLAYVLSALKNLSRPRMKANMLIGNRKSPISFKARTVVYGICGKLPGNITLFPNAQIDDGWLEIGIIDVKSKLFGWVSIGIKIILQGIGLKTKIPEVIGKLEILRAHDSQLETDQDYHVQIDGEAIGTARKLKVRLQSQALIVRTI